MSQISTHLQRHHNSGIYYFRLTVPEQLRPAIGKREIKTSLRTGLRSEATLIAMACYLDAQKLFHRIEVEMGKNDSRLGYITGTVKKPDGTEVTVSIDRKDPAEEAQIASQLLGISGGNSPDNKVSQPKAAPIPDSHRLSVIIKKCVTEHKASNAWTPKTIAENQAIFQLMKEILRNPMIESIGFQEARRVKEVLLELPPNYRKKYPGMTIKQAITAYTGEPISLTTRKKYMRRISSLFNWAVNNGYCHDNPFNKMTFAGKDPLPHEQRKRFDRSDLDKILNPAGFNKTVLRKNYQYWLPLLALFTGARLEELCQLHIDDIRTEDGVPVVDINDQGKKHLKTKASKRLISCSKSSLHWLGNQSRARQS